MGSDEGGAGVVRFGGAFEVEAEFDDAAGRLGLEFDVRGGVASGELEDGPHDPAGRCRDGWREGAEGEVLGEEEEFAGLELVARHASQCTVHRGAGPALL